MMTAQRPLLFTFRRCPYAMRARLAIGAAGLAVAMREVELRNKPVELLQCSPKGTVPVLLLEDGRVLEESLDIMRWALTQVWPANWLARSAWPSTDEEGEFLELNDRRFKPILDRYKYPDRHPSHPQSFYRSEADFYFEALESRLQHTPYLFGAAPCLVDAALLPFVRQFAMVDLPHFRSARTPGLIRWLDQWLASELFLNIMSKAPRISAHQASDLSARVNDET